MHDAPRVQLGVVKAACAGLALGEPEALQNLRVQCLPARRRPARATQAAPELGTHPRLGNLWWEGNARVLID
eukprot:14503485-Alexandrium_andersonii.AAC.1